MSAGFLGFLPVGRIGERSNVLASRLETTNLFGCLPARWHRIAARKVYSRDVQNVRDQCCYKKQADPIERHVHSEDYDSDTKVPVAPHWVVSFARHCPDFEIVDSGHNSDARNNYQHCNNTRDVPAVWKRRESSKYPRQYEAPFSEPEIVLSFFLLESPSVRLCLFEAVSISGYWVHDDLSLSGRHYGSFIE